MFTKLILLALALSVVSAISAQTNLYAKHPEIEVITKKTLAKSSRVFGLLSSMLIGVGTVKLLFQNSLKLPSN